MEQMYCYVGDVLGFSDMVTALTTEEEKELAPEQIAKFSPDARASRVDSWVQLVSSGLIEFKISHYHFVSDTVFVGTEYTRYGLERLIDFSKYLLEEGMKKSLPLRGGIACGDVEWGDKISFGTAIIKAHKLEADQEWIGTCCEPDLPGLDELWDFKRVFVYPAPMKNEKLLTHRPVIAWHVPTYVELRNKTSECAIRHINVDWKYDTMIRNTMLFSFCQKLINANFLTGTKPNAFPGKPMAIIESCVDWVCHDKLLEQGGWKKQFVPNQSKETETL